MLVPLLITGGTHQHKSKMLSNQYTQNFWPQIQQDESVKSPYILESWGGLKPFATLPSVDTDRGGFEHQGVVYFLNDEKLFSVDSGGTVSTLASNITGAVSNDKRAIFTALGTDRIIFVVQDKDNNDNQIGRCFQYNSDDDTLTEIYGTALTQDAANVQDFTSCSHLNSQIIYTHSDGRFSISDVDDATTIQALKYGTPESDPDELIRGYVHKQLVYFFGSESCETWWNTGIGTLPFDRVEGGIMPFGLGAKYSVAHDDEHLFCLTDEAQVLRIRGTDYEYLTPNTMNREFSTYSRVNDAIGWTMNVDSQWFYCLTFPEANKTWVLPKGGEWFNWSYSTNEGRSIANSHVFAFRKNLFGDVGSGKIYELDADTYTDNGQVIKRVRQTGVLHGGQFGANGKKIELNRLELILEVGTGLTSGQGSDPDIILEISTDGGRTFGTEMRKTIGAMGEFHTKVEWFALGSADSFVFRFSFTDPVYLCIHSAVADIEIGI